MDTPAVPPPRDAHERAIMDKLITLRDKLLLLKQDRTTYIRSQDVLPIYDQILDQVKELTSFRQQSGDTDENRLDKVLESCFQLLSLLFLTIGRNQEAPAAYSLTSTIKRILDHLTECALYSEKDLQSMSTTLGRLSESIQRAATGDVPVNTSHSPYLITLLANRVSLCQTALAQLEHNLESIAPSILEKHEKCISILRCMCAANTKTKFSTSEVLRLQKQLLEVGDTRTDGKFLDDSGNELPGGPELTKLYDRISAGMEAVLERKGRMSDEFLPMYITLVGIRNDLEKLSLTQAWSLRETDLYDFQRQLDKIDESRVDGNFLGETGQPADLWTQRTMLYLIRRSYGYIYSLMIASEPVSEALLPVYNQLQTLKRCLVEVKNSGGVSSVRELYPYSMKLNSLDNMRVDGKFVVNGDIPEGQGSVTTLLAECFEMNYELRVAAEEAEEAEEEA